MATQCRSSKCTAERKGFRRELDSWRHKLIHCVGFESILEGIYGPRLLQDLNIFDECEPEAADDWSVDANCSFCNLQLEKLNDHPALVVAGSPPSSETPPPQGLSTSEKLQCQADRFLHAIFHKKEIPQRCDPSIPLVAQELMRKMVRRFAFEYACKSQAHEDMSDDSEPFPLQTDPDGPLDLTVSRASQALPQDVDGVLDLSKKNTSAQDRGRLLREDCLDRSSQFAEGLLSKALKDIHSGSLDVHKAAILYGIPQKTLLRKTEALSPERKAGEAENSSWTPNDSQLILHKVAAWARSQPQVGKSKFPVTEHTELKFPATVNASSYLHHLTLQRMVLQLREQSDGNSVDPATSPTSPVAGPAVQIRIPQVRFSAQPKAQLDLAALADVASQANKAPDALHKLKTVLPRQSLMESHSGLESRLLQGDLPPLLCLNIKNGSVTGSAVDCGDNGDRRDKQPRKKRGRYRQYDHDILEEAIAMVIGGKMSVSKAQGVYGVPHSTLEYKVKERTGTLKIPPKKKLRLTEMASSGSGLSGTTINASSTAYKQS